MRIPYPPDAAHEITTKTPPFSSDKTVENGVFFYCETHCGAGRETRPLQRICPKYKFCNGQNSGFHNKYAEQK